jgi:hypothetical protein
MTPVGEKSYLEQCIAALPAEKREAARRAFYEISETGDDSYLSKLLTVLEANGAYARKIPKEMTDVGAKVVREMQSILDQIGRAEAYRRELLKEAVATETMRMADALPVRHINDRLGELRELAAELGKLARKIDTGVSSGAAVVWALFTLIAGIAGTVWFFWTPYHEAMQDRQFEDSMRAAGLSLRIEPIEAGSRFSVWGPKMRSSGTKYDESNGSFGIVADFDNPR